MINTVLRILIDNKNQFISGKTIGDSLNISRMAVNKHISKLKEQGYNITSITNKGYCLLDDIDLLDKDEITSLLNNDHKVLVLESIDSTNNYLKQNKEHDVVIANVQTSGRGRQDRKFFSPKNSGIYMSINVKPNCSIDKSLSITALTSIAIYQAIKNLYNLDLQIKWVNDLILNSLKVGGILCEAEVELNKLTLTQMVIGIGLNISKQEFPNELKDIATSIENNTNKSVNRNKIIAEIINCFDELFYNNKPYFDLYKKQSNTINKQITVYQSNTSYQAKAIDIDENGCLIVQKDNEIIKLSSGEISIR